MTVQEIVLELKRLPPNESWQIVTELLHSLQPAPTLEARSVRETVAALRGRGRGERLVERLRASRREDQQAAERYAAQLRH
ncbi:MAG: hypothetical protein NZM11_06525 [Anaerolineales bacterium]|nr:hypothetical protein [Anaerolineales bacterium]